MSDLSLLKTAESLPRRLKDIFQDYRIIQQGPFRGMQLNTRHRRSVFFLGGSEYEKHLGASPDSFLIANVFHQGRFYIARKKKGSIKKIKFLFEDDKKHAPHVMLRFDFYKNEPLELIAEIPSSEMRERGELPSALAKPIFLPSVAYSVEVIRVVGQAGYSPLRGLKSEYGLAFRLLSLSAIHNQAVIKGGGSVQQYSTDFTEPECDRIFYQAVDQAHFKELKEGYHFLFNNCRTNLFRPIQTAVPRLKDTQPQLIHESTPCLSTLMKKKTFAKFLAKRGYLRLDGRLPHLEQDPQVDEELIDSKGVHELLTKIA